MTVSGRDVISLVLVCLCCEYVWGGAVAAAVADLRSVGEVHGPQRGGPLGQHAQQSAAAAEKGPGPAATAT